jgi:hypothetical protein
VSPPRERNGYALTVSLKGPRLSAANKRAVGRACAVHGLFHYKLTVARRAASALSMLNAVDCVHVARVLNRHVCTFLHGIRDK